MLSKLHIPARHRKAALHFYRKWTDTKHAPITAAVAITLVLLVAFGCSPGGTGVLRQITMSHQDARLPFVELHVDRAQGSTVPRLLTTGAHPAWAWQQPIIRQNLVLCMTFYPPDKMKNVKYLIRSFKQSVSNGTLVLFLKDPPFAHHLPDYDPSAILLVRVFDHAALNNPYVLRWFIYHAFLTALRTHPAGANASAPLLTVDGRDTVLQRDPFRDMPAHADSLSFFSESGQYTIMDEHYNRGWIEACYGKEGTARVGGMRVVNSGTNWGPRGLLLTYFKAMMEEYLRLVAAKAGAACLEAQGIDQGIHQYMLYSGGLAGRVPFRLEANEVGSVLTGHASEGTFTSGGCMVRNLMGRPFVVLHQWDRVKALKDLVEGCYPGGRGGER